MTYINHVDITKYLVESDLKFNEYFNDILKVYEFSLNRLKVREEFGIRVLEPLNSMLKGIEGFRWMHPIIWCEIGKKSHYLEIKFYQDLYKAHESNQKYYQERNAFHIIHDYGTRTIRKYKWINSFSPLIFQYAQNKPIIVTSFSNDFGGFKSPIGEKNVLHIKLCGWNKPPIESWVQAKRDELISSKKYEVFVQELKKVNSKVFEEGNAPQIVNLRKAIDVFLNEFMLNDNKQIRKWKNIDCWLRYYLWVRMFDPETMFVYHFVPQFSHKAPTGGIVMGFKGNIHISQFINIVLYINSIYGHLSEVQYRKIGYEKSIEARKHGTRSAVAAIMARNMSHLLGSHIEPGIQSDLLSFIVESLESSLLSSKLSDNHDLNNIKKSLRKHKIISLISSKLYPKQKKDFILNLLEAKEKALERYSIYRQKRMDFIARISTDWSLWGTPFEFYKYFVFPFMSNSILLHFVGYSDGFTIRNLDFQIEVNGKNVREKSNSIYLKTIDFIHVLGIFKGPGNLEFPFITKNYQPFILWSRGADMSVQAFHIILENILRNSIKHSKKLQERKNLVIGIFLFIDKDSLMKKFKCSNDRLDNSEEYIYIVISSNVDESDISYEMDYELCKPILKETGEKDPEAWGLKEIKVAAAFLANKSVDSCNDLSPSFIQTGSYEWNDQDCHLAYCFIIPKFYYVGVLKNE